MSLLNVNSLSISFGERTLFSDVSFEVNQGDRIGLVGVNGCGKTTLFNVIQKKLDPTSGGVHYARDMKLGTVAQMLDYTKGELSLYDYTLEEFQHLMDIESSLENVDKELLSEKNPEIIDSLVKKQARLRDEFYAKEGLTYKARTRSCLLGLGFSDLQLSQSVKLLSGGQRNKAQLARVLLSDSDLLLLDEPTNHLDITSVSWLEDFLCSFKKAFIVISHDRYFLDKVTNRIIELKHNTLYQMKGNYSRYIEQTATKNEIAARHYQNTQKEIRRLMGVVEQQKRWGQEHNFITAESKQKQIERLKKTLVAPERDPDSISFNFRADEIAGNDVLLSDKLSKSFGDNHVFSNASIHIKKGDRVFILGENGCGKTTLLKIFSRKERPDSGSFYYGAKVRAGYYDQNVLSELTAETLLDEMVNAFPTMSTGEIRNAMARFLFVGDDVYMKAEKASGGEKARVQLLKLMLSGANLLLLDEPTNHLDIASREALERALESYGGTMIIVTHDRYLVNRLADRVVQLTKNGLVEYIGGYDEFIEAFNEQNNEKKQQPKESQSKNTYLEQKELRSSINKTSGELSRTEKAIAESEALLKKVEQELSQPSTAFDYKKTLELSEKADSIRKETDMLYEKWNELTEALDKLKQRSEEY